MYPVSRLFIVVSTVAALGLAGCSKPSSTDSQQSDSSTGTAAAPTPTPTPAPTSTGPEKTPVVSAPTPAPKLYAPEGTLFATQRITITNDEGVISIPSGSKLKIVKKTDTGYVVTDGRKEFSVEAAQVTNEIGVANAAAQAHIAELALNTPRSTPLPPPVGQAPEAAKSNGVAQELMVNAKARATRIATLQQKSANLAADIADMNSKIRSSAVSTRDVSLINKNAVNMVDANMMNAWKRRLAQDVEEKNAVDQEIGQLQAIH